MKGDKKLLRPDKTNPFVWFAAIICAIAAVAVIIAGVIAFVGYLIVKPRVPFISVTSAHLDTINFDQAGLLETRLDINVKAENDNAKAHATFSDVSFILSLHGMQIAKLVNGPFDVKRNSSTEFNYVVESSPIPLDAEQIEYVDSSLKKNQMIFHLKGSARTQWRVGPLGSIKYWCHLDCQLQFTPFNGSYTNSRCTSKSR